MFKVALITLLNNYQLKTRPKLVQDLSTPEQLDKLRAHIECQQPKVDLYQFIGTLTVYGGENGTMTTHLGLENLLPRGCRLKDTSFIYGKDEFAIDRFILSRLRLQTK